LLPTVAPRSNIHALAKLLHAALFLVFVTSANAGDFEFSPSKTAAITQQDNTSYQHFTLTKKSDTPSQVRHVFAGAAVFDQSPDIVIVALPPKPSVLFDDFALSLFTLDIPPP
jgi:hypothetical protein